METLRIGLGLVILYIMPVVITFWLVIHSLSSTWRKTKPHYAYGVAGLCILAVVGFVYAFQTTLLGDDLGFNMLLFIVGLLIYLASWVLWRPVKKHLDFKTFAGVPEVKNEQISLITKGPFAMVRHPRYLMVGIGVIGWCMMSNYLGAYVIGFASLLGLVAIVRLEERDLIERFGEQYRAYQKEVPQLIPTLAGTRRFLAEIL